MPPTLPVELYREILVNVDDHRAYFSLLKVSRAFLLETEPFLYRNIVFHTNRESGERLLQRLIDLPRLAQMVQRLDIPNDKHDRMLPQRLLKTVAAALCTLVNLHTIASQSQELDITRLADAYPFQLREYHAARTDPKMFVRFLAQQPALERLVLPESPAITAAPALVPRLRVLEGGSGALLTFLRHRRIECVRWTVSLGGSISHVIPEIAASLFRVRALAVGGLLGSEDVELLAVHLLGVEHLVLMGDNWRRLTALAPRLLRARGVSVGAPGSSLIREHIGVAGITGIQFTTVTPPVLDVAEVFSVAPVLQFIEVALREHEWFRWERGVPGVRVVREPHEWTEPIA